MNQQPLTPKLGFKYVLGTAGDKSIVTVTINKMTGNRTAYEQYHANLRLILLLLTEECMYLLKETVLIFFETLIKSSTYFQYIWAKEKFCQKILQESQKYILVSFVVISIFYNNTRTFILRCSTKRTLTVHLSKCQNTLRLTRRNKTRMRTGLGKLK